MCGIHDPSELPHRDVNVSLLVPNQSPRGHVKVCTKPKLCGSRPATDGRCAGYAQRIAATITTLVTFTPNWSLYSERNHAKNSATFTRREGRLPLLAHVAIRLSAAQPVHLVTGHAADGDCCVVRRAIRVDSGRGFVERIRQIQVTQAVYH